MDSLASEIFLAGGSGFQKACMQAHRARDNFKKICESYKWFLDRNFDGRFCIDGHCETIFMVEISFDGFEWGATPKIFSSKEEAEKEAKILKHKYSFLSECRVVTRNIEEEERRDEPLATPSSLPVDGLSSQKGIAENEEKKSL